MNFNQFPSKELSRSEFKLRQGSADINYTLMCDYDPRCSVAGRAK